VLFHINGRRFLTGEQREARGLQTLGAIGAYNPISKGKNG
jgi:hypothetical protein